MIGDCLRSLLGLFCRRDYDAPKTCNVVLSGLSLHRNCASLLFADQQNSLRQRHFLLLNMSDDVFERALNSLQQFIEARESVCLKYVESGDAHYKVVTDVEQFIQELNGSKESSPRSPLGQCLPLRMLQEQNLRYSFSVEHGELYWIAVLRTGEFGNRFPHDERLQSVVRYETLKRLLRNRASALL